MIDACTLAGFVCTVACTMSSPRASHFVAGLLVGQGQQELVFVGFYGSGWSWD